MTTEVVTEVSTLSKKFYSQASTEAIVSLTELISWAWAALQAPNRTLSVDQMQ